MRLPVASLVLTCLPLAATGGPFEGLYRPNFDATRSWDCQTIGIDGGALAVQGDRLRGIETECALSDPVEVRGMAAVLYDAACSGEGETNAERVMLMTHAYGIYVIRDGIVADWLRCE